MQCLLAVRGGHNSGRNVGALKELCCPCTPSSGQLSVLHFQKATFVSSAGFTTPRAILTGHDCEVTCASVCAELGLVISGCKGKHSSATSTKTKLKTTPHDEYLAIKPLTICQLQPTL